MSELIINITIMLACLVGMEAFAFYSHKYVMHGFMWSWHKSHHTPRVGVFEKNDLFAFYFALPSVVLIWLGNAGHSRLLWAGIGIALYGLVYFIFHDVIVHRRIRTGYIPKSAYMKRIVEAHWVHHSTTGKENSVSFGFIYAPPVKELLAERDALQRKAQSGLAD
jgi:beta-carotene 3-hydroxylase